MSSHTAFAHYVTSTAFHLSLSRAMALCLHHVDNYEKLWRSSRPELRGNITVAQGLQKSERGYDNFIPAIHALERRGLVEHHDAPPLPNGNHDWSALRYSLTEAGKHVLVLCALAGIVPEVQQQAPANRNKKKAA